MAPYLAPTLQEETETLQQEYLRIDFRGSRDFRANNINQNSIWWQQDGAPSHTSNETINYLRRQFPGKAMSRRGDWRWPPRSPYLAIPDFFLWGHLKHRIWSVGCSIQAAKKHPRIERCNCKRMCQDTSCIHSKYI